MSNLYVRETYINATEHYCLGESQVYETHTDNLGELFHDCQKQHGRCVSSMYCDLPNGKSQRIGWIFVKRARYEDSPKYYLQEVWVSVYDAPDTATQTVHYHTF